MMIYRFRAIFDTDTDDEIFRDFEIREDDTLEDLNNVLIQAFGFDGTEVASFYIADNEWNQGEEISQFDLDEGSGSRIMSETTISDVVHEASPRLIYVYDFLNLWTFLVELAEIVVEAPGVDYPNLIFSKGQIPDEAPDKTFKAELTDEYEEDDFEDFSDYNDLDDMDENQWN